MDKIVLVLGGDAAAQKKARAQLEGQYLVRFPNQGLVTPAQLEAADVIFLVNADEAQANLLPHYYRSRAVIITHDPSLFERAIGLGYLAVDRNTDQLLSLVQRALERIHSPNLRVLA